MTWILNINTLFFDILSFQLIIEIFIIDFFFILLFRIKHYFY